MSEKEYIDGLYGKMPNNKAPDFIIANASIRKDKLSAYLANHDPSTDWINLDIVRQKRDPNKLSFVLNQWKPAGEMNEKRQDDDDILPF